MRVSSLKVSCGALLDSQEAVISFFGRHLPVFKCHGYTFIAATKIYCCCAGCLVILTQFLSKVLKISSPFCHVLYGFSVLFSKSEPKDTPRVIKLRVKTVRVSWLMAQIN